MTEHRTDLDRPRAPVVDDPTLPPQGGAQVAPTVGSGSLPTPPEGDDDSRGRQAADEGRQQGRELAGSAKEQGAQVAQSARDQGRVVAREAKTQAREVVDHTLSELRGQADQQTNRVSGALSGVADQVRALADGRTDEAGKAGDYANDLADRVSDIADRIERLGFDGVVREVGDFARRRPGAFLAGAALAGLVAGRFVRNAGDDDSSGGSGNAGALPASTGSGGEHARPTGSVEPGPSGVGLHLGESGGTGAIGDPASTAGTTPPPIPPTERSGAPGATEPGGRA